MIMALLLFGISCSNNATKPSNSGSNPTNDTEILNDFKTAALAGLGESLEISTGTSITLSDTNTGVIASQNIIYLTITNMTINTPKAGDVLYTKERLNGVLPNLKTEMAKVGVNITSTGVTSFNYISADHSGLFYFAASKIPDTETTKYELPGGITHLVYICIKIYIGSNATWVEGEVELPQK